MVHAVDLTINPAVSALKPSKTMALTDLALSMKEQGIDVSGAWRRMHGPGRWLYG